jgi:hypothetical protein
MGQIVSAENVKFFGTQRVLIASSEMVIFASRLI